MQDSLAQGEITCPRCGQAQAIITDRAGLDRVLARYYQEKGLGLIEVCMCADPRQLAVMWNNVFRKVRGQSKLGRYLACAGCAFWQISQ